MLGRTGTAVIDDDDDDFEPGPGVVLRAPRMPRRLASLRALRAHLADDDDDDLRLRDVRIYLQRETAERRRATTEQCLQRSSLVDGRPSRRW